MEPTECSETSAFNIQTPGKYPEYTISTTRRKFENYEDIYMYFFSNIHTGCGVHTTVCSVGTPRIFAWKVER
jgi:hypothetical protein